jgi:hypothetical protein
LIHHLRENLKLSFAEVVQQSLDCFVKTNEELKKLEVGMHA